MAAACGRLVDQNACGWFDGDEGFVLNGCFEGGCADAEVGDAGGNCGEMTCRSYGEDCGVVAGPLERSAPEISMPSSSLDGGAEVSGAARTVVGGFRREGDDDVVGDGDDADGEVFLFGDATRGCFGGDEGSAFFVGGPCTGSGVDGDDGSVIG